jgi:hypothetical protein
MIDSGDADSGPRVDAVRDTVIRVRAGIDQLRAGVDWHGRQLRRHARELRRLCDDLQNLDQRIHAHRCQDGLVPASPGWGTTAA